MHSTPALVDSHCHLNQLQLENPNQLDDIIAEARAVGVSRFLSVCITLEDVPHLQRLTATHQDIYMSVGVHPSETMTPVCLDDLIRLGSHPSCIAIGETGLDYYRLDGEAAVAQQQIVFRDHIKAALVLKKPLIIHTREARADTLSILQEEGAQAIGGVLHCFTETLEMAKAAIDLNFYISFSGILTFKNAVELQAVAKAIPLDRILIETDSPYLAPVPFRGKPNHPALVKYVALKLSELKEIPYDEVARVTTENFYRCFRICR